MNNVRNTVVRPAMPRATGAASTDKSVTHGSARLGNGNCASAVALWLSPPAEYERKVDCWLAETGTVTVHVAAANDDDTADVVVAVAGDDVSRSQNDASAY